MAEATEKPTRKPGRPKGHPRSGGRAPGTPNKKNQVTRDFVIKEGAPLAFLCGVVRGKRITAAAEPGLSYTVQVSGEVGGDEATFRITNTSTEGISVVTGVYFHDGVLLGIANVINGPGVELLDASLSMVSPVDLPGGNMIGFETTDGFALDAADPSPVNGLNNGEYVEIVFELMGGGDINTVIAQLSDFTTLRVGIHIQQLGLDGEESASGSTIIPAPPALALCALGLGMVGWVKRRTG